MFNRLVPLVLILLAVLVACRQAEPLSSEDIQIDVSVDELAVGDAELIVNVTDPDGNPITDATIDVRGDMNMAGMTPVIREVEENEDGAYTIPFEWTMGGDWFVDVTATLPDGTAATERFEYSIEGEIDTDMADDDMSDMDMEATEDADDMSDMDMEATEDADDMSDMDMEVTEDADDMSDMDMEATEDADDMSDMDMEATEDADGMDMGASSDMSSMSMPGTSAAYMQISNNGDADVTLISADVTLAGATELHETVVQDDVARMIEQEEGIVIPAGETILLQPGSFHVMLLQLEADYIEGETADVRLVFDNDEEVTFTVPVQNAAPQMDEGDAIEVGDLVIEAAWVRPTSLMAMDDDMSDMDMEDSTEEAEVMDDMETATEEAGE